MTSRNKYSKRVQEEEKKRKKKKAQKCRTAIKILEQYHRLAERRKTNLSSDRLARLNALRDAGTITIKDLPGSLHKKFPTEFSLMTLAQIREHLKNLST